MALKFRRGTTAQKSGSLAFGEPYVNTTLGTLQVGLDTGDVTLATQGTSSLGQFGAISGSGLDITGNANIAGNLTLGGNITIGDQTSDTVTVTANLSSSLIPSVTNTFDLGSSTKIWRDLYLSTASIKLVDGSGNIVNTITNTNIVTTDKISSGSITLTNSLPEGTVSGSSQVIGILQSLNAFSSSTNISVAALNDSSSSQQVSLNNLNLRTGSYATTGSNVFRGPLTVSSSIAEISIEESSTGKAFHLRNYNGQYFSIHQDDGLSIFRIDSGSANGLHHTHLYGDLFVFSGSVSSSVGFSGSVNGIGNVSAYSASVDNRLANLLVETTNLESTTASLNTSVTNINSFTSSFNTAFGLSGANVTVKGNLTVQGLTTQIDSTTINIADNIIQLNGTGATNAGLVVRDATAATTTSGSFLWDTTNDKWIAGPLGSEDDVVLRTLGQTLTNKTISGASNTLSNIANSSLTNSSITIAGTSVSLGGSITLATITGASGIVSGSSQITPLLPAGTVSGSSQVIGILTSLNSYTGSNDTTNTNQNTRLTALETSASVDASKFTTLGSVTASYDGRFTTLGTYTGSVEGRFSTLATLTGSNATRLTNLETTTASLNISVTNLNSFSASALTRLTNLETETSNLELTSASVNISVTNLNSFSASENSKAANLATYTGSVEGRFTTLVTYTGSINTSITNLNVSSASQQISIDNLNSFSSSENSKAATLATYTGSVDSRFTTLGTYTSSLETRMTAVGTTTGSLQSQLTAVGTYTSSLETRMTAVGTTTGSINTSITNLNSTTASLNTSVTNLNSFSSSENSKAATLATYTGSVESRFSTLGSLSGSFARTNSTNTFSGNQVVSGSLTVTQDFVVLGSSSIQNISSSTLNIGTNLITVAVNQPSVRFGGIAVIDSGSAGQSGSLLYDSVEDEFIFVHRAVSGSANITSSHFIMGPETVNNLGNETYLTNNRVPKGTGKEHLNDSNISDTGTLITLGSNTQVNGTFFATGTTLVSGSAQISGTGITNNTITIAGTSTALGGTITLATITGNSGIVSGSSQITPLLPAGTISGSSQVDATATTNWTTGIKTQLNSNTVVSGSSQVIGILTSLNSYTASNDTTNTSQNTSITNLNSFSASALTRLSTLETETSNLELTTASLNTSVSNLNSYTSSFPSAQVTLTNKTLTTPTISAVGGDEGGQIDFALAATNQTLTGSVSFDIWRDRFRIFEGGGTNRGVFLQLSSASATVGSELIINNGTQTLTNKTISGASNTLSNIGNASLTNSSITIAGTSISLGGSITAATILQGTGVISGSSQLTTDFDSRYLNTNGDSVVSGSSQISHDSTTGYSANRHVDHTAVSITAGSGLTGGGDISTTRTISIANLGVTDAMLAGSISNAKLSNSAITIAGTSVSLGSSITLATITAGSGIISGSSQLTTDFDSRYLNTGGDSVVSGSSQIAHDSTTGYSANRHIDHTAVSITAGSGLNGGGDISSTRTLSVNSGSMLPYYSSSVFSTIAGDITISSTGTATITANSVALGTDTTGDYVASLVAGTGVTLTNNSGEGATPTIAIGQSVATSASPTFAGLSINGAITATGDITAFFTSDKRHKNNIQIIPNALQKVSKLNGVTWEWNDDVNEVTKSTPKTGLIAQEVQEVLPEVVREREDGFLSLDYSKMMGLLVEAIKEQQTHIHNLTLQIEELKKQKGL